MNTYCVSDPYSAGWTTFEANGMWLCFADGEREAQSQYYLSSGEETWTQVCRSASSNYSIIVHPYLGMTYKKNKNKNKLLGGSVGQAPDFS